MCTFMDACRYNHFINPFEDVCNMIDDIIYEVCMYFIHNNIYKLCNYMTIAYEIMYTAMSYVLCYMGLS